ncbi:pyridoxamine 5'-phosphate oxidase family protein [Streptomyces sp. NBC_00083]|uniref:pyridoxamine 5'-phosphate oxidase family protein n=1 Tax=Streptomyces sp. NBC_00083 TaxID=2975647 RepID=UPI0022573C0C|nr:pyridoxamine 5'-phosphate oxidase family protein [Streptomyces sp. NBC_00083]MCX5387000.1 pyridoxamine 5'-phosphate oxidase family protein [Streptomyces sp. NBC_00083]
MTHFGRGTLPGFHEGELAVQRRAGTEEEAARLTGMMAPAELGGGVARFLADRTFAAVTARDEDGALWISPLVGPPGFLHVASPARLRVRAVPAEGDPLRRLRAGQAVGLIVVDFAIRRRLRVNGTLAGVGGGELGVDVEQAYGNCPQYIQSRHVLPAADSRPDADAVRRGSGVTDDDAALIRRSDTFLIGSAHPTRGNDASHRGGPPGFVRVDNGRLWWPDYWGNNMFNTLGNIAVDPSAALLFCDFTTGRTLHLSGRADLEWLSPGASGDDDHTGRRVHFTPRQVVAGHALR